MFANFAQFLPSGSTIGSFKKEIPKLRAEFVKYTTSTLISMVLCLSIHSATEGFNID